MRTKTTLDSETALKFSEALGTRNEPWLEDLVDAYLGLQLSAETSLYSSGRLNFVRAEEWINTHLDKPLAEYVMPTVKSGKKVARPPFDWHKLVLTDRQYAVANLIAAALCLLMVIIPNSLFLIAILIVVLYPMVKTWIEIMPKTWDAFRKVWLSINIGEVAALFIILMFWVLSLPAAVFFAPMAVLIAEGTKSY